MKFYTRGMGVYLCDLTWVELSDTDVWISLLKPTGYVHQQFNIQQLYALPTLYLCVLYLSENKQATSAHIT